MNCAQVVGRLTAEPEVKVTGNNKSVLNFTVAAQEGKDQTHFIDCVAWEKTADFIGAYFRKGQWISVDGSLQTRNYEDKNGVKHKATEIRVAHAGFCSNKAETISPDIQVEESETSGNLPF